MASAIYNGFKSKLGTIDWSDANVNVRVMLVTNLYTVDIDAHINHSDITNEITGTGYTAGGNLLTSKTIVPDLANDFVKFDADNGLWANSTLTARGAVVYLDTGVSGTSTLIAFVDFVTDKSSSTGDFIVQWHQDGIYRIG